MNLRHPRAGRAIAAAAPRTSVIAKGATIVTVLLLFLISIAKANAATFYVDGPNGTCNNAGPGTEAVPYCTITAAMAAHNGPGVTIAVKPGTYVENATIPKAGAAGNPFVLQALAPGVILQGNITASSRPWITIDGFTVNATGPGIFLGSSSNSIVTRNTVTTPGGPSQYGLYASYASNLTITGNTVANFPNNGFVIRSVTNSIIENNVAHHTDTGFLFKIDGAATSGNVIRHNRAYSNATTGFYYQAGANDNLSIQNLAWSNGDHGIQHSGSQGNRHIGDVVWGNLDDGVSIRSGSTGTSFFNCIFEQNGLTQSAYEISVDTTSTPGWASDDNIIRNSMARPLRFGAVTYSNIQSFSMATGNDFRTDQGFPRFIDPENGDFRLLEGSPAIDCGNTSLADWPGTDFLGQVPFDDAATPNSGIGSNDHADRGAFEFVPIGMAPVAVVNALPAAAPPTLQYRVDASGSYDPDGAVRWYRFDFGNGTTIGPMRQSSYTYTFAPGNWTVTATVFDDNGRAGSAATLFTAGSVADVSERRSSGYALAPITPNPVLDRGRFAFTASRSGSVRVSIVDLQGRTVARPFDRRVDSGRYESTWDGRQLRAGLYFLTLEAPGVRISRRFVLQH